MASEAVELWGNAAQEVGYAARVFAQTSLPYRDPGNVPVWTRHNGNRLGGITLNVSPGFGAGGRTIGYPHGTMPRLLLTWMSTEAVRTKESVLPLGESLSDFMRQLGLAVAGGPITRLREQMRRLLNARISVHYVEHADSFKREVGRQLSVATSYDLWWSARAPDQQATLLPSYVQLSEEFFREATTRPVPVSLDALRILRGSPMRLDIYTWLTYRMSYLDRPTVIPWEMLRVQFGSGATSKQAIRQFRLDFLDHLAEVRRLAYPEARASGVLGGIRLCPSPPHVSRGDRSALSRLAEA
jgi:hypothetical protein